MLCFKSHIGKKIIFYGEAYSIGVESDEFRIASNNMMTFYTGGYNGSELARIESNGMMKVTGGIRAPEIWSTGLLKIQPDVQGDVELFGDTNVSNSENSKILKMWRKAAEGNDYIRFYISSTRVCYIHSSNKLTLQAQNPFTINSVTDDIIFKVGDNAGVKKFYFKDNDNNDIAIIDSNGKSYFAGNMGIGITDPQLSLDVNGDGRIRGNLTVDELINGYDLDNLAPISSPEFTGNITMPNGIWKSNGYVGIGTNEPHDNLHIIDTSPSFILEESDANNSEKVWELTATGGQLKLLSQSDLYTATQTVFVVDRGGTSPTTFCFPNSKIGIKTSSPTSNLHVTGLNVYANNAAAISDGLTTGAFYRNGADTDKVCVVH